MEGYSDGRWCVGCKRCAVWLIDVDRAGNGVVLILCGEINAFPFRYFDAVLVMRWRDRIIMRVGREQQQQQTSIMNWIFLFHVVGVFVE